MRIKKPTVTDDEAVRTFETVIWIIEGICVLNIIGFIRLLCNKPFLFFRGRRKDSIRDMIDRF